jgi:glycosyltransferase involved in cell wall biosynthesis
MQTSVSIIICTRDRAESLAGTLAAMANLHVPHGIPAEVVVVDNGSQDRTRDVVRQAKLANMQLRYVLEPCPGQSVARNRGMAEADGQIILFTDDDVRPGVGWVEGMCRPILEGEADAVAGGVRLAPHLQRRWMTPLHRSWLASTEYLDGGHPQEMVGANMAFARRVLQRVPGFDVELGPGALGQGDDALFSWQVMEAGYRLVAALHVEVEHHCEKSRLTRESFFAAAARHGRTRAYLRYHWEHTHEEDVEGQLAQQEEQLADLRRRSWRYWLGWPRMPAWELVMLRRIAYLKQWMVERQRPRNYERRGLVKIRGTGAAAVPARGVTA